MRPEWPGVSDELTPSPEGLKSSFSVSPQEDIVPAIPLAKGWSLTPNNSPTIAHYLVAVVLGIAGLFLGLQLSHPLLPCFAVVFVASYLGGLGPGLLASLAVLAGTFATGSDVHPSHGLPEIAIACGILAWSVSRFRHLERTREVTANMLDETRLTLDRIPVGTWTASADGSIFSVNQWLLNYTGLERGFFEDKSGTYAERQKRQEHLDPDDRDRIANKWHDVMGSEQSFEDEFRMRHRDGVFHWFKAVGESMRDENGKNIRWYGALVCIDKQKEVETELRRTEHDLRLIVETIPAFVWCAGPNGENIYVNQRLLNYSGATAEEFTGEGWARFLHPDDVAHTSMAWQKSLETGDPYEWSYRMRRADGVYEWFLVLAQLLRDESGAPLRWYGIDFNIDAQKRAEETLGETQARLSRSAQFATVAEFAAAIAHEVAQPLFGANMNVEACLSWLSADPPNIDRAKESALIAIEDGKDAAKVIQKVRALFRKSEPLREPMDIYLAINEVIRLMRDELLRRRISVEVRQDEQTPSVYADRLQIQQVMWNLIHNAADAMEGVESDRVILIKIQSYRSSEVSISVSDRGAGFAALDRAFEAFFTTKKNGMGMGLTISKTIIESHGGHLQVTPNPDAGTTLIFNIPTMPTRSR
jgi:PAS domain S-box-containing protein